jgi:hypothetical protein
MQKFDTDDKTTFRKRVIGIILATDMARHVSDLGTFKSLLESNDVQSIQEGGNVTSLFDKSNSKNEFDSKQ